MTKEQIIDAVHNAKCKKMEGLNLERMTREDLIAHLKKSCCPVVRELCKEV